MTRLTPGRVWAYVGAGLGAGVSVAANVAHSYVPPPAAGPGWEPHTGSVWLSAFWPVAVLVAVEILARVPWPAGGRWVLVRWAGLVPVAVVAAVVSYRHLSALLAWYGDDPLTAALGPLAVDGLMVMATAALIATSRPAAIAESAGATKFLGDPAVPGPTTVDDRMTESSGHGEGYESPPAIHSRPSRPARRGVDPAARQDLVDQLAAAAADSGWRPDYTAVRAALTTAGLPASQSSAERVVRDARAAARARSGEPVPAGGG